MLPKTLVVALSSTTTTTPALLDCLQQHHELRAPDDEQAVVLPSTDGCPRVPRNLHNSCFADSVMGALLLPNTTFITDNLLRRVITAAPNHTQFVFGNNRLQDKTMRDRIQNIVRCLFKHFQGQGMEHVPLELQDPTTCMTDLMKLISECNFKTNFWDTQQQDACEFLACLCDVFHVGDSEHVFRTRVDATNDILVPEQDITARLCTSQREEKVGLVFHVFDFAGKSTSETLRSDTDQILTSPLRTTDSGLFYRILTSNEYVPRAQMFVLHIDRSKMDAYGRHHKDYSPLMVEETICSEHNTTYALVSVVVHHGNVSGGHYTCFAKIGRFFAEYDDTCGLSSSRLTFGQLSTDGHIKTHGVLFFYHAHQNN
jgi:hypothetical protein